MAVSYEKAGVNLEAGYEVVRRIKKHVASTSRLGVMGNIGACGGMAIPVLIFVLTCPDDPLMLRGSAIPMATDIAFSLGVLSMFGKRGPIGLKIFLATLAVADDLGGILVIAIFYSTELHFQYLAYAAHLLVILAFGNHSNEKSKKNKIIIRKFD